MLTLAGARLLQTTSHGVELTLDRGFRLHVQILDERLARLLVIRPGGLRIARSWSLSPELSDPPGLDPLEGRDRLDLGGFPGTPFDVSETETEIYIETRTIRIEIKRSPLAIGWAFRQDPDDAFKRVLQDRPTQPYQYARNTPRFIHALTRHPQDRYYGFGEKSGDADKHGRRLRMGTTDALGYDAESSDPLYKHIPFHITVRPDHGGQAVGLFYDNLARGAFDLGQEIDAYHGPYRTFEAEDGDLDLYVLFGPAISDIVTRFTALTGRTAFPPRWALGYSGSTMQYTDAPNATERLDGFLELLSQHDIPCRSFHLSSGYTLVGDKRCVFTWDRERFPDPAGLFARFAEAGLQLIANIKPAMLLEHPRFAEIERFNGFVRDSENPSEPHKTQFWGGEGAYLDFTNPYTSQWWSDQVTEQLIANGINATWNDNNEFEIWDDAARVDLSGEGGEIACLRPVQANLMMRASQQAQIAHAPGKRPFLVSRSGGPGMQRYVQTWSGDNRSDWKTLRYNLRMGHGMSLSGLFNFGHDVGGFAGPAPEPELLMRWIEQGIYWPRFTIHSWNQDGSATEPWSYPELLPLIRTAMTWRERLTPYLYTLLWRAHTHHEPVLRPLFYDFPSAPDAYVEDDSFMVGSDLLVAPVLDPGATRRELWLPDTAGGWYDVRCGTRYKGGGRIEVEAPLGEAPAFARAGSILPLGPPRSHEDSPLTLRLYPVNGAGRTAIIFDDDGESLADVQAPPCLITASASFDENTIRLNIERTGARMPRWSEIRLEDSAGNPVRARINDGAAESAFPARAIPTRGE